MGGKKEGGGQRKRGIVVGPYDADTMLTILERLGNLEEHLQASQHISTTMIFKPGSNPVIVVSKDSTMSKFESSVQGNVGALSQGDKSQAINQGAIGAAPQVDLNHLAADLTKLFEAMKAGAQNENPDHEADLEMVRRARDAALKGESSKVFSFLKRTGTWTCEVATKIGAAIATEAIMHATGLKK